MFMPILMKTWLKSMRDHAHCQQFAQAIARLAGNFDSAEQNHGIKREHHHAANESFLLGNDGENEVVMCHGARQVTQSILGSLAASLCPSALRNRPKSAPARRCRIFCRWSAGACFRRGWHCAERNPDRNKRATVALIIFQLDLPIRRREQTSTSNRATNNARAADDQRKIDLTGTPATNIMAKPIGSSTSAEPRSGSFRISRKGSTVMPGLSKNTLGNRKFFHGPA